MSSNGQKLIDFSVRKSCRTTRRLNYDEKVVKNSVINESKTKTKSKELNEKKSQKKTSVRRLDENKDKCDGSPPKIKKTSEKDKPNKSSTVKQLLSPSNVESIVGRDKECHEIRQLIGGHLESRQSVSVYISGAAGTGKTLSVSHVINGLKQTFDFKQIFINCMSFRNSKSIFAKIFNELKDKKTSKQSDCCLQTINGLITETKSSQMIVLILDEIDQLLDSKSHEVLNTIFLWTKLAKSRLILIGIANALDFSTKTLSRIKSIGLSNVEELHFMPYNTQQIIAIIEDRIRRATDERNVVISSLAIQLCARKIGSCSGDIRKALDVCRRALDLVESKDSSIGSLSVNPLKLSNDDGFNAGSPKKGAQRKGHNCVDVPQIMEVLNQVYGQKLESNSKSFLPFNQQIIICALLVINKHKNLKEVKLSECHLIFANICSKRGISYNDKSEGEFLSMCQLLEDTGFVSIRKDTKSVRNSKISLRVDESEVEHSFNDQHLLHSILQQSSAFIK